MTRPTTKAKVFALVAVLFCMPARAEWIPPPKLEELLKAGFIAIGHFRSSEDKTLAFVSEAILKGEPSVAEQLSSSGKLRIQRGKGDKLTFHSAAMAARTHSPGGTVPIEAGKRYLWFFSVSRGRPLECQPAALADGYRSLLAGRKPFAVFRLLQALDLNLRRQAMEELVANRDGDVIGQLHKIAETGSYEIAIGSILALSETKLLQSDRFWGKWTRHPAEYWLKEALHSRDSDRFLTELKQAIEREENPSRLSQLLWDIRKYPRDVYVGITLQHLDHPSADVRQRVVGTIWDTFWVLGAERKNSKAAQAEFDALSKRVVPMLKKRMEVEKAAHVRDRITRILREKDRLPLVVSKPRIWCETDELKFLLSELTSRGHHDYRMDVAGREVVDNYFDKGFAEMKKKLGQDDIYNTNMVMDGIGYLRDPRCMSFLVKYAKTIGIGHRNFHACLVALARQNSRDSYDALMRLKEDKLDPLGDDYKARWFIEALGELRDLRALAKLKELRSHVNYHGRLTYVLALAKHGDQWAASELVQGLRDVKQCDVLKEGWATRSSIAKALTFVDTDGATEALKEYARTSWPERADRGPRMAIYGGNMESYAGSSRRSTALGEVARRDPRWLGALALEKMGSEWLYARQAGYEVFRQLTGRSFDFRPSGFAHERREPLDRLRVWWEENRTRSREQWLLSYFAEKGFPMRQLYHRGSLSVLCEALESDWFTRSLAIEQISAVTQKYFGHFAPNALSETADRARVLSWLKARGYLRRGVE